MVFSSGQIPVDPATGEVAGPDIAAQAEQSCKNVKAVIEAIAGGYNDMKFYSYEYLLSRIEATNWLQIFFAAVVVLLLLFALIMSFRDKKTTKYRELSLIALLLVLVTIAVHINNYQSHKRIDDQYSTALRVIEQASVQLEEDKTDLYINTQAARDGAIIKTKEDQFYRIISVDGNILLEKMDLYNPQIEIVDVKK